MNRTVSAGRALAICLLMAFAALLIPLEVSQPIHFHEASVAGLYNGECLLATLAAFQGAATLPGAPSSILLGVASDRALSPGVTLTPALPSRATDSRAPPLA